MIVEVLAAAFNAILKAVQSEADEKARIRRAKREILALSLRLGSDSLLRKLLARAGGK